MRSNKLTVLEKYYLNNNIYPNDKVRLKVLLKTKRFEEVIFYYESNKNINSYEKGLHYLIMADHYVYFSKDIIPENIFMSLLKEVPVSHFNRYFIKHKSEKLSPEMVKIAIRTDFMALMSYYLTREDEVFDIELFCDYLESDQKEFNYIYIFSFFKEYCDSRNQTIDRKLLELIKPEKMDIIPFDMLNDYDKDVLMILIKSNFALTMIYDLDDLYLSTYFTIKEDDVKFLFNSKDKLISKLSKMDKSKVFTLTYLMEYGKYSKKLSKIIDDMFIPPHKPNN